jgi:hypothetical protein
VKEKLIISDFDPERNYSPDFRDRYAHKLDFEDDTMNNLDVI